MLFTRVTTTITEIQKTRGDKAISLFLLNAGERQDFVFVCVRKLTKIIHVYKTERKSSGGSHEF